MMNRRRTWARRTPAVILASLVACVSTTGPAEIVTLQAELVATDAGVDPVTGSIALVIGEGRTQMGIGIEGGAADARLGWAIRTGACAATGTRLGPASTYPAIAVGASGHGQAETVLQRRIATDVAYAGELFASADGTGAVLACADLDPRN